MNFDGSNVNILVALVSGMFTFVASCLFPLVPTYLSYLSGVDNYKNLDNKKVFKNALAFVIGFIFIFVLMGITINSLSITITRNTEVIRTVSGVFLIFMAILISGLINLPFLSRNWTITFPKLNPKWQLINSFLVGVAFGFGWTPCIGPVLAVVLYTASKQDTFWQGTILLISYGVGLGIPFLLIALGFTKLLSMLSKYEKYIRLISATLIAITGILLIQGDLTAISIWILENLNLNHLTK